MHINRILITHVALRLLSGWYKPILGGSTDKNVAKGEVSGYYGICLCGGISFMIGMWKGHCAPMQSPYAGT